MTQQRCEWCDDPTGRSKEDELRDEKGRGPLCEECFDASKNQVYCHECSKMGCADVAIYHDAPVCSND